MFRRVIPEMACIAATCATLLLQGPVDEAEYLQGNGDCVPLGGFPRFAHSVFGAAYPFGQVTLTDPALAALLRIPVAMSNVEGAEECRPHSWGLFGVDDPIGADYRACRSYGPLYA